MSATSVTTSQSGEVRGAPVRRHIEALQAVGMGRRRISDLIGVAPHVITSILRGTPCRDVPPPPTVPAQLARRVLTIPIDPYLCANTALIPAVGTHRRLQALVHHGWSLNRVAGQLGVYVDTLINLLDNEHVHARTARAVRTLYDQLWDQAPPHRTRQERGAVTLARRMAARNGWHPALAWDDDSIDDPAAAPQDTAEVNDPEPDELAVSLLLSGRRRFTDLAPVDRRAAVQRLIAQGLSSHACARHLRTTARAINTHLDHHRIDGLQSKR